MPALRPSPVLSSTLPQAFFVYVQYRYILFLGRRRSSSSAWYMLDTAHAISVHSPPPWCDPVDCHCTEFISHSAVPPGPCFLITRRLVFTRACSAHGRSIRTHSDATADQNPQHGKEGLDLAYRAPILSVPLLFLRPYSGLFTLFAWQDDRPNSSF